MSIAEAAPQCIAGSLMRVLHAGCGSVPLPDWLVAGVETRLDLNPAHAPGIVGTITDLGEIGEYDIVYCSHTLEHLYPHDVPRALAECHRVLAPGGALMVFVPDLEGVEPTEDVLFESPAGPISGLDLIYGHRPSLGLGLHMEHRTGFVQTTLRDALARAGFARVVVNRLSSYNLMGVAVKP